MIPAIASPSLNRATKASISHAPGRARKSRNGAITACTRRAANPAGARRAAAGGSGASSVTTSPQADQRRDAQQRRMPADRADRGDHPGGGYQQRDAISPDIGRHGRPLAVLGEHLDAPGIDDDVLARRQEGDHGRDPEWTQRQARRVGERQQRRLRRRAPAGWRRASRGDGRATVADRGAGRCRAPVPTGTSASRQGRYSRSPRSRQRDAAFREPQAESETG